MKERDKREREMRERERDERERDARAQDARARAGACGGGMPQQRLARPYFWPRRNGEAKNLT